MEIKSTNINKTSNYISFQMIKKKTTTYVDVNPIPGLGLAQTCIGQYIEELDHNPPPSWWLDLQPQYRYKQTKQNVYLARRIR